MTIKGMASALEEVDALIADVMGRMGESDLIIITADHGNDPTTPSTDHSREYTPVLVWAPGIDALGIGDRKSFADVGATVAKWLGVGWGLPGESIA